MLAVHRELVERRAALPVQVAERREQKVVPAGHQEAVQLVLQEAVQAVQEQGHREAD